MNIFLMVFVMLVSMYHPALALEIPLTLEEPAGIERLNAPVTSGIPLPPGTQTTRWALLDGSREIPLQLTRMAGRTPWLLLDFQVSLPASGKKTLRLRDIASSTPPPKPLEITEDADRLIVTTGPLQLLLRKNPFNLFEAVWLDADNNGDFAATEQIVSPSRDNLQIVDSTSGHTFSGRGLPDRLVWEYRGPMRATLRIEGRYRQGEQEFVAYTTRLSFYAGHSFVKIEHVLRNSYQANERHVKIRSATITIGAGATAVQASRSGSISWVPVRHAEGVVFEMIPPTPWPETGTAANNGMVLPDWSYHGATLFADFSNRLSAAEQTRRTRATQSPLFAMAPPAWYAEYAEFTTSKFSTLDDEKHTYRQWGWSWDPRQEPTDPHRPGHDYGVHWGRIDVHDVSEADDLWQHVLMYVRTGQRGYLDRAQAWARYFKWEYTLRTDGFDYAWNGNFESPKVPRSPLQIPLSNADATYLKRIATGRVDVLKWGADHFWGWGLIDYYYLTGDTEALEAARDLGEISERVFGHLVPGDYAMGRSLRRGGRHLLFATRLYEATLDPRWQKHMEHMAQLWLQSPGWDPRGFYYDPEKLPPERRTPTFQVNFLSHGLERYYSLTGDTLARKRLVEIAKWAQQYGLHATYQYAGRAIYNDRPNPGEVFHEYFDDGLKFGCPCMTVSLIDTLVRGYRLTGDLSFLERAKYYWDRGSKGVYKKVLARTASDKEVGRFVNNRFLSDFWYAHNHGDLPYAHLLHYDYAHLTTATAPAPPPPATPQPTGVRAKLPAEQATTGGEGQTPATSAAIIAALPPGHWYEVPHSHLRDVAPCGGQSASDCKPGQGDLTPAHFDAIKGTTGFRHIIDGWNGGAFDTKRDRLIIWGGGHAGWAGNEVYVFDLNTLTWARLNNPSVVTAQDIRNQKQRTGEWWYYADGKPRARHSQNSMHYVPVIDRFCLFGIFGPTGDGQGGATAVDCFNFDTLAWERYDDFPGASIRHGTFTAYDPIEQKVWLYNRDRKEFGLFEFTPVAAPGSQWRKRTKRAAIPATLTAAIDPRHRKLVAIGGKADKAQAGVVYAWDIDHSGNIERVELQTSGANEIIHQRSPGLVYDAVSKQLVAWSGGADVYTFDMETLAWTKHIPASTNTVIPTQPPRTGTYGRFQYSPRQNVFVVVNSVDENVYMYRLTPRNDDPKNSSPSLAPTTLKKVPE